MTLIARAATLRFLRRRRQEVRDSAGRWLALALRWRRPRRPRARAERRAQVAPARTAWQPHFHWHLELRTKVPVSRTMATTRHFASMRESKRVQTIHEHRWHRPASAIVAVSPRVSSASREWRQPNGISPRPMQAASAASKDDRPITNGQPSRHVRRPRLESRTHSSTRVRSIERALSTTNLTRHHYERSVPGRLRQVTSSQEHARTAVRTSPALRPVEIAWRTTGNMACNQDQPAHQRSFDALLQSPQHQGAPHTIAAPGPSNEPKRPTVLQIADLDASVVDRLTDDVIRRVERRVRIERERRGM